MFQKIAKHLAERKLRKSIQFARETLYSENFDLDFVINSLANRDNPKDLFRAYVAINTAAELSAPLNETDLESVLSELEMIKKLSITDSDFIEILELKKKVAELSWLHKQQQIFEGKLAHQANPYSYEAGIYMLEKTSKGPVNGAQKKKMEELALGVADSEKKLADYLDKKASEEAFDKWFQATVTEVERSKGNDYSKN